MRALLLRHWRSCARMMGLGESPRMLPLDLALTALVFAMLAPVVLLSGRVP